MTRWNQADVDRVKAHAIQLRAKGNHRPPLQFVPPSKYGNTKTGSYASKREAKRAAELKAMQAAGEIADLREQVKYEIIPKQKCERACYYIADFVYLTIEDGEIQREVVEDVKGYRNPVYRIKRKLMLHVHGIRVRET